MATIKSLRARQILDSRGDWTIETTVILNNNLEATAAVPQGKSSGSYEAVFVTPPTAIKNTAKIISPALRGINVRNQKQIDELLIRRDGTPNKSKLGANAVLGASLVCARAAAMSENKPLWQYFRRLSGLKHFSKNPPLLLSNVINGGLHAGNNLDFQEYMVIPLTKSYRETVPLLQSFYHELGIALKKMFGPGATGVGDEGGFAPKFHDNLEPFRVLKQISAKLKLQKKLAFGLDAAASNVNIPAKSLSPWYQKLVKNFPILFLEDAFGENEFESFARLNASLKKSGVWFTGDDLTTTNPERMRVAHENNSINSIIIKPNQIGTLTETLTAVALARQYGWRVVVSHRSGETNDDLLADLAYGVGADGIKLGGPARGERIAKYNRLLEIESENS